MMTAGIVIMLLTASILFANYVADKMAEWDREIDGPIGGYPRAKKFYDWEDE